MSPNHFLSVWQEQEESISISQNHHSECFTDPSKWDIPIETLGESIPFRNKRTVCVWYLLLHIGLRFHEALFAREAYFPPKHNKTIECQIKDGESCQNTHCELQNFRVS